MGGYWKLERLPVDPEIVREITSSPAMGSEQGSGFMQDWGGPYTYRIMAELPSMERMVYRAVLDNYSTVADIEVATGLDSKDITSAVGSLVRKGLVSSDKVTITP